MHRVPIHTYSLSLSLSKYVDHVDLSSFSSSSSCFIPRFARSSSLERERERMRELVGGCFDDLCKCRESAES